MSNYNFLLHTWSLAVEIQYYVVVPVLIMLLSIPFIGKYLWSFFFAASLYYSVIAVGPLQFSSLPSRIWQFTCGGAANFLPNGR